MVEVVCGVVEVVGVVGWVGEVGTQHMCVLHGWVVHGSLITVPGLPFALPGAVLYSINFARAWCRA